MSYNGSGTFVINSAGQPAVTGTVISSTVFNAFTADIGTGLSTCVTKDGQTTTTAAVPFAVGINVTSPIVTPSTTFALVNTTATTVNFAGAATTITIGAATGTTTIANAIVGSIATDSTSITTGAWKTAGGLGVAKALWVGGLANIAGAVTLQSTLTVTGTVSPLGLLDISGASAGQIKFPATQNSSADANTLDDYEEGTWTPNQGSGLTLVGAFSSNGLYTKIGREVHLQGQVVGATSVAVAATGQISSNVPFTSNAGASAGMGGATNNSVNVSNVTYVAAGSIQILSCTAIAASASIFFTANYMT